MKRSFTLFLLLSFISWNGQAQDCLPPTAGDHLHGNNVRAFISGGGGLFFDGSDAGFQVPAPEPLHTIFAQGLWLGGIDPGGNLKIAAQTYGRAQNESDYFAGPLNEMGATDAGTCQDWDRIWSVFRYQVEAHLQDFADNGAIDNPIPEIMGWPGKGNPHFAGIYGFGLPPAEEGLAPFFDQNGDGVYDPMAGDYPMIKQSAVLPEQITWSIFNDAGGIHTQSQGNPLQVEVHLTTWAFNCSDNPQLNNTIFTSYKVINRGIEPLDSTQLALWTDFDLGCHTDDFFGSAPELNSYVVYNQDNEDDLNCPSGVNGYGENPPVQAVTVLNKSLTSSMYYVNPSFTDPPAGVTDPNTAIEFYRYMTGSWRDGTPLTFGGDGYDPSLSNPVTSFAFPGDPNDPNDWSAYSEELFSPADRRAINSVALGMLPPGGVVEVDFGYSFFREEGADFLENVTAMYAGIEALQGWYDDKFETACSLAALCEEDCVWAGDANADGIANHCDLLPMAVGENAQGPTRRGPYNWAPRDGDNWTGTQNNGANNKHLDANGNGTVSFEDFFLSEQHYNLTRPDYQAPAPEYREGPELVLDSPFPSFNFDNLAPGEATALGRVRLAIPVPELYALAFSLEYDTAYFEIIRGEPSGYDFEERSFRSGVRHPARPGDFDFARASTGGDIEVGLMTLLYIKVKEAFTYPLPADTSLIRFKNIKAIRADGTEIEIGGTAVVARFQGIVVDTEEPPVAQDIRLFPNPTTGRLELRFPGHQLDGIEVLDATGKRVWRQSSRLADAASLELPKLSAGIYFVRMRLGENVVVRKVVVRR